MRDGDGETKISSEDPLAWTMIHCPRENVFMLTATLLIKLHFCDVMCLHLKCVLSKNVQTLSIYVCIVCRLSVGRRNVTRRQTHPRSILFGRATLLISAIQRRFVASKRSRMYLWTGSFAISIFFHFYSRKIF